MSARPLSGLRTLAAAVASLLASAAALPAQLATSAQAPAAPAVQEAGRPPLSASARREIEQLRRSGELGPLPAASAFTSGGLTVARGTAVDGPVYVAGGPLVVEGTVRGNAVAVGADIVVREGGSIAGDASSVGGRVRLEGGSVGGELRSLDRPALPAAKVAAAAQARSPLQATWRALKLTLGWLGILFVLGFGLLTFSEPTLNGVVEALEEKFGRAFAWGLLAQLAAIPLLLLIVVALAISIIGILLIPFAIVAWAVGLLGLLMLGFLAVARFTGAALWRDPALTRSVARTSSIRALITGLAVYMGLWALAALFTWSPLFGVLLRAVALGATWVAVTLGLGAVVASRVMLRNARRDALQASSMGDALAWQTPTPITGVAAARRRPHVSRQDAVR